MNLNKFKQRIMKKMFYTLFMVLVAIPVFAQFGLTPQSRIENKSIKSEVLGAERSYTVLLPKSYETNTDKKYPVLYLLHGSGFTDNVWFERLHLKDVMDLLVSSGEASEMIVVTPNAGGNILEGAWNTYYDISEWKYETFFFTEFLPYIEKEYRITEGKSHRAIGGFSMGGGASVWYAQHYPEMFSAVYAMSSTLRYKQELIDMQLDMVKGLQLEDFVIDRYRKTSTKLIENDCVKFVEDANEATENRLRSTAWFIDFGDDDHYIGLEWNTDFVMAMRKRNIPCEYRVRNGGHDLEFWHSALYFCLPFASRNFGR